ncbi:MAG: 30S ribosomal protein S8 [Candidatus Aminicenantes bacterium]|nr:30S ribosomal protein S8 [Candidatus Aminicenantes bacterium]
MSHTDPIADMLTRIRNAIMVGKKDVEVPLSKIKLEIANVLKREGYISGHRVDRTGLPKKLIIDLKYTKNKKNVIEGLLRISKPGRRTYSGVDKIPKVLGGLGISVVSTSKGMMTGKECRKNNIGGEVLFHVW